MKLKTIYHCLIAGLFTVSLNVFAKEVDESIVYKNQRGSSLTLTWNKSFENTGSLTGTFNTAVGNCKKDMHVSLPIVGYYNGNAISISINFPHCKQTVAMTGNVSDDRKTIHTIWLDANHAQDPRGNDWNTNLIGSDSFQRI